MVAAPETTIHSMGDQSRLPDLRFIHYNDVYHVEAGTKEPVGGIARFKSLCQYYQSDPRFQHQPNCMTFFSGDSFSPSIESSITKGKHMVPALNAVNTTVACLGNHDLDFGVDRFKALAKQCNFPWLCANVLDPALGQEIPLGNCKKSIMLKASNGIQIGVLGLVEKEWLDTINSLPSNLEFREPSEVAKSLAAELRSQGAEMVIALTHQRQPNDEKLARSLEPGTVDIILSGHDHIYAHSVTNGTHVLRSGTDYKQLSYLEARRKQHVGSAESHWDFNIWRRDITSSIQPDPKTVEMVAKLSASLENQLGKPIGCTATALDARFSTVRQRESNIGNFVTDIMRLHYGADAALMASGTIRGDQVYPPGVLRVKDIMDCFPFEDPCVVVGVSGRNLLEALENSVSKYPALEGRFPQVSNIRMTFDPNLAEGKRVSDVYVDNQPLEMDREYSLVTRDYMVRGKDGFTSLVLKEDGGPCRSIVDEESGMLISTLLRQYFTSIKVLNTWMGGDLQEHWNNIHADLHDVHPVKAPVDPEKSCAPSLEPTQASSNTQDDSDGEEMGHVTRTQTDRELFLMRKWVHRWWHTTGLPGHPSLTSGPGSDFGVSWTRAICPQVEGRIRMVAAVSQSTS